MRIDLDLSPQIEQLPRHPDAVTLPAREAEEWIAFHYSGVVFKERGNRDAEVARILSEARFHLGKNWGTAAAPVYADSYMYDVVVLDDGARVRTNRTRRQLYHCGNRDGNARAWSVHVLLGADQDLTDPQRASLFDLFDELRAEMDRDRSCVVGHNEFPRRSGPPRPSATYRVLSGQSVCPGPVLHRHLVAYRALADRPAATGLTIPLGHYTEASPILGPAGATFDQAVRFVLGRPTGGYTAYDLARVILPAYFQQAQALGIDPIVAIAQAIHETGNFTSYWAQRPRRNPAGIGVDGSPGAGVWFADWTRDAIPAQLGRLLAYALPAGQGTPAQQAAIAKAMTYRPLPAKLRGTAPQLYLLGAARNPAGIGWADPGDQYGARIAVTANAIARMP